jgi:long-subunit acyl-CoA synthetase (AMP-forming)
LDELNGAALVLFTSGSTGEPKGAILESTVFHGKLDAIASVVPFDIGMRTLVSLRMSFGFGIWVALLTLRSGGTVELADLSVADALQTLCARRVERWAVVPTMLRALLAKRSTAAICPLVKRLRCERSCMTSSPAVKCLDPPSTRRLQRSCPVWVFTMFSD